MNPHSPSPLVADCNCRGRGLNGILTLVASIFCVSLRVCGQALPEAPDVSAAVDHARTIQVYQGWPLLLEVSLRHPRLFDPAASPLNLTADAGRWSDLLRIEIQDAAGAKQAWPLILLNSPAASITLDGDRMARLYWSLSPQQTSQITTGAYQLIVVLDTTTTTNQTTWKGVVKSVPVDIRIDAEPAQLTPTQRESKYRALAEYHLAWDRPQEALNQINLLLQADPTNIGGLTLKASILKESGRNGEALQAVQAALDQVNAQHPNAPEAPRALWRQQFELSQLLAPGRINSLTLTSGTISLEWNAIPGDVYSVQSSSDLLNWMTTASGLVAQTNLLNWTTNRTLNREFFRVGQ